MRLGRVVATGGETTKKTPSISYQGLMFLQEDAWTMQFSVLLAGSSKSRLSAVISYQAAF